MIVVVLLISHNSMCALSATLRWGTREEESFIPSTLPSLRGETERERGVVENNRWIQNNRFDTLHNIRVKRMKVKKGLKLVVVVLVVAWGRCLSDNVRGERRWRGSDGHREQRNVKISASFFEEEVDGWEKWRKCRILGVNSVFELSLTREGIGSNSCDGPHDTITVASPKCPSRSSDTSRFIVRRTWKKQSQF